MINTPAQAAEALDKARDLRSRAARNATAYHTSSGRSQILALERASKQLEQADALFDEIAAFLRRI